MFIIRIVKWLVFTLLLLLLLLATFVSISSYLSLDRSFTHSYETELLPAYSPAIDSGMVRIAANGFQFRARIAGNITSAPTVILLHGFPVTSAMWEPLIEPLALAGYRVIAFDQRGYSPGARPQDPAAYGISKLISDVLAVADAVGAERFHLVGHDWGSAVGWGTVMQHPERIQSWTGISIAHPAAFADALENDPDQQSRSAYFLLFVMPFVPERLATFADFLVLKAAYTGMPAQRVEEYLKVFAEPGAMTSALNWYRQMNEGLAIAPGVDSDITTPSLFIWGNNDPSAGRATVDGQEAYMKGPYRLLELDGDHWLVNGHSSEILPAMLEHLGAD